MVLQEQPATPAQQLLAYPPLKIILAIIAGMLALVLVAVLAGVEISVNLFGQEVTVNQAPKSNPAQAPVITPAPAAADPQALQKHLYDITDLKTVDAIAKLDEDHEVRAKIIMECAKNSGPCATSFRPAYISWPGDQANYSAAKAYVCSTSTLFDKHLLIVDRANNRGVVLPATGNAGDVKGPCGGEVNDNGQKIKADNFVQLSNQHLDCLNNGNAVTRKYYPREIKQVDPNDFTEGCIEELF